MWLPLGFLDVLGQLMVRCGCVLWMKPEANSGESVKENRAKHSNSGHCCFFTLLAQEAEKSAKKMSTH